MHPDWLSELESKGFGVCPNVLAPAQVEALRLQTKVACGGEHSLRGLLGFEWARLLAKSEPVRAVMEAVLGKHCFAVRGLFFDKIPDANWLVPPHQDLSIAVKERHETEGYGPWSRKEGVLHVQPPREILENMATIRLHLDDCDESNGALRVVAASHQAGKLSSDSISLSTKRGETSVPVPKGGAMVFRPLLIHASSPSHTPSHRRVVHLEFAAAELPPKLQWHWRV